MLQCHKVTGCSHSPLEGPMFVVWLMGPMFVEWLMISNLIHVGNLTFECITATPTKFTTKTTSRYGRMLLLSIKGSHLNLAGL